MRLVLREKEGRDDGRGRKSLGFALCETRGHAESIEAAFRVALDFEPAVEPDDGTGCSVPHVVQSRAVAPAAHGNVNAR